MRFCELARRTLFAGGMLALTLPAWAQNTTLQVSQSSINFTAPLNGAPPPIQAFVVTATGGAAVDFSLLVDGGGPGMPAPSWLTVTPVVGTTPAEVRLAVNPAGLAAGTQSARIQFTDRSGRAIGILVPVNLQVATASAQFLVIPSEVRFSNSISLGNLQQGILVQNLGSGSLAPVSVTVVSGYPWLRASLVSCDITCSISVGAVLGTLSPGPHTGMLNITTAAGSQNVPVSVFVGDHGPYLTLSSDAVQFETIQGSGFSDSRTLQLTNVGDSLSVWSVSVVDGAKWLTVSPPTGNLAAGGATSLTIGMNTGNLTAGTYGGMIRLTPQGSGADAMYLPVALLVDPPATAPAPEVSVGGGVLLSATANNGTSQQITLTTPSANTLSYRLTTQSASWLTTGPASGQVSASAPIQLTVAGAAFALAQGYYDGLINVALGAGPVRTLHAGFAVSVPSGSQCIVQTQHLLATSLPDGFVVAAGTPLPLQATFVDDCGNLISNGFVFASFSNGDPGVVLLPAGSGQYTGTWTPTNSSASLPGGSMAITLWGVSAPLATASASVVGAVTPGVLPAVATGGVLNNLYPQVGAPVSPGTVVQIYGSSFGTPPTSGIVTNGMLSTTVNGVSVTVDGAAAPMFYASPGQINVMIPAELQVNQQYQVVVHTNAGYSRPEVITTASATPGLLTNSDGTLIAQDGNFQLINAKNPAHAGQVVVLYLVGMGATTPVVPSGTPSPSSPLAKVSTQAQVSVDGNPAQVSFAGLTPNFVGLYQVNVQIPPGARSGSLPVVVMQGTASSNSGTILVQ